MKTQAKNKLTFKKNAILELNDSQLYKIQGGTGTSKEVISLVTDDPNGSSPICPIK